MAKEYLPAIPIEICNGRMPLPKNLNSLNVVRAHRMHHSKAPFPEGLCPFYQYHRAR